MHRIAGVLLEYVIMANATAKTKANALSRPVQRALLLRLVDEAYDKPAWHGTNLKGSIRRVSAEQAVWRPGKGRHNIAEIVIHCAYWKYAVHRRITGGKRGSFPLKGSNWFAVEGKLTKGQWKDCATLLAEAHAALREALATAGWARLADGPGGGGNRPAAHVHGAAMHDLYHAGQIQTIKALRKG